MSYLQHYVPNLVSLDSLTTEDLIFTVAGVTLATYLVLFVAGRR